MAATNQQQVVDTATEAFMRYGFRRVTMGLANPAGISKPALYGLFPNKQEVFRAAVQLLLEPTTDALAAAKKEDAVLWARVQKMFDLWTVKSYRLIHDYTDARKCLGLSGNFAQVIIFVRR